MPTYALEGRLGKVIARGGKLSANVAERVVSGEVNLTAYESTQLTLVLIDDADLNVLGSRLFAAGTPTRAGSRLDYGGLHLEVRAVEVAPAGTEHRLTITARSLGIGKLKRERGAKVRRNLSPTQFARAEAKAAGLKFIGQPSPKRKTIARKAGDDAEASWDTITRLAEELGFIVYEAAGVLYFGKPTWLVKKLDPYPLRWKGEATADTVDALPTCRRTGDDAKRLATVAADLRGDAAEDLTPGRSLALSGVPTFEGTYLIESITIPLAEGAGIAVDAITPVDPEKVQRVTAGGSSSTAADGTSTGATGAKSAAAFVAIALAQAGDTYIYGAEAAATNADPNAFDCSELVEWAAARAGVPFIDGSAAQIAAAKPISVAQGIATRGALLYHPGHIAISLGNGKTIEAANSRVGVVSYPAANRFTKAGLIPGMRY